MPRKTFHRPKDMETLKKITAKTQIHFTPCIVVLAVIKLVAN